MVLALITSLNVFAELLWGKFSQGLSQEDTVKPLNTNTLGPAVFLV